ncbi:acid-sensing ion channel 2-like isoform X1 [Acanthaster planci]|uniref:Acid-sensing ion channel 2-like isoform X1 n=1 Tax=Acanthaster planci TaxID=133434 RepID=A0A8B7YI05_ACAPL|nr:acid-sensing ion channel 2-like isoform X1 [Acanthaster planci]
MVKPSARIQALSNGGAVGPMPGSVEESDFEIADSASRSVDHEETTKRRGVCRTADDPDRLEVRNKRVLLFRDFTSETSLHGIKYVANSKYHICRRFIWLILFLAAWTGFIILTADHFRTFFEFDTTTSLSYMPVSNLTLPAITICNYNAFKKSAVIESGWESLVPHLLPFLTTTSFPQNEVDVTSPDYENLTFPEWDSEELSTRWGHRIEDMLLECRWKQSFTCGPQDFEMTWTDFGPCFTFNGGDDRQPGGGESPYVANDSTSEEGLWLRLNLEQHEYIATPFDTAGFRILIHSRYDWATFVNPGIIQAAPGFTTIVPLTKRIINAKKYPYVTNCTDDGLKYFATYTPNTCLLECMADAVLEECGCYMAWMSGGDQEVCDFATAAACGFNALVGVNCTCNMPCTEEQYMTRVSHTATPAQYAIPKLSAKYNMTAEELRNNIVDLYVYIEDMRVTVIEHKEAYDFAKLTSDIGGELGLLLGASVLTVFEFLDYLAVYHLLGLTLLKNFCQRITGKRK